jgi:hypothetical protein
MKKAIVFFIAVLAVSLSAELTIIDFENIPDEYITGGGGQNLGDYYPDVIFGPSVSILDYSIYTYPTGYFPPHTGFAVADCGITITDRTYPYIKVDFDGFVCDYVELWYTCNATIVLEAYNNADSLPIATAQSQGYYSVSLPISLTASNIAYVIIHNNGLTPLVIDDFGYQAMAATSINVAVDILPGTCPNLVSTKGNRKLDVTICGTSTMNANSIDIASLEILGVKPVQSGFRDVATPISDLAQNCDCSTENGDGILDLTLKFDKQAILAAIGPAKNGDVFTLPLTGMLMSGTPFTGTDCITIVKKGKK